MPADVLADTGAILALLNREDRWHRKCLDAFRLIRLPLITSEVVLTELFQITGTAPWNVEAGWKFVRSGYLILAPILDVEVPALHAPNVALCRPADGFCGRHSGSPGAEGLAEHPSSQSIMTISRPIESTDGAAFK